MKKVIIIFLLMLLASCEKEIDLNIKMTEPKLVVKAMLSNDTKVSAIEISLSEDFIRDETSFSYITSANVQVTDDQGNEIIFQPNSEGVYKTDTPAIPGRLYYLQITYKDYQVASCHQMLTPINLENVLVSSITDSYGTHTVYKLLFRDPNPDIIDYYIVYSFGYDNNGYSVQTQKFFYSDLDYDDNLGGIKIEHTPLALYGTESEIKIFHIDKSTFDFYKTLEKINRMQYGSSPFVSTVPGNPNFNIDNGIGFFSTPSAGTGIIIQTPN